MSGQKLKKIENSKFLRVILGQPGAEMKGKKNTLFLVILDPGRGPVVGGVAEPPSPAHSLRYMRKIFPNFLKSLGARGAGGGEWGRGGRGG
jgi:hypothetical protein